MAEDDDRNDLAALKPVLLIVVGGIVLGYLVLFVIVGRLFAGRGP